MSENVNRERMTIMRSMYDLVKRRENRKGKEDAYALLMMVVEYGLNGVVPDENSELYDSFIIMQPTIDNSNLRSEWGKQGGRGHAKEALKLPLTTTKLPLESVKATRVPLETVKEPLYDVDVDVGGDVDVDVGGDVGGEGGVSLQKPPTPVSSSKRFVAPTVQEVEEYCRERGNEIKAQKFVDHYAAIGWMIGKTKMKDWKAAVRTWEQRDRERREESGDQRGDGGKIEWDPNKRSLKPLKPADAD